MILGEDGEKMSKSRGNVINPDEIVEQYGGDAMRLYEMFMGPLEAVKPWQTEQIAGVVRFQNRVHALASRVGAGLEAKMGEETQRLMHQTIRKVTTDVDALSFNTAISSLMVFSNHLASLKELPREPTRALVLLLSPMAPHVAEEAWQLLGHADTLAYEAWPEFDDALCEEAFVVMGVQVNGKVRGQIRLPKDADEATARELALAEAKVEKFILGKEIKKFIYVPGRIVNVVVGK
jgi:leucyl-tRNA synthetase